MTIIISTTIKRKWLDQIEAGTKTRELKAAKQFWKTRLHKLVDTIGYKEIVFLCGRKVTRYKVKFVTYHSSQAHPLEIDGELVTEWYEIHLGDKIE